LYFSDDALLSHHIPILPALEKYTPLGFNTSMALRFLIFVLTFVFLAESTAQALSAKQVSQSIDRDFKIAVEQVEISATEFWDVQITALNSDDAKAVSGQYRLIDGLQWDEIQFVAVKALEEYLEKINTQTQMKNFFPEVHSKLEQVTKIWIERRSGLRPKGVDADYLPGDLRNQYPGVVREATSLESLRFKSVLLETSRRLSSSKSFNLKQFTTIFTFYFNYAAIENTLTSRAATPLEQEFGRIALKNLKNAESVNKKFSITAAEQFNKLMGGKYKNRYKEFKTLFDQQLNTYRIYLSK